MNKLMPIILILASVGIFFMFIDGQYKEVQGLMDQKNQNDKMLEDAKTLDKEFENLQKKYREIKVEDREILEKILPETVDNVRLILDINNIADNYGIIIRDISVTGGPIAEDDTGANNTASRNAANNLNQRYGTISLGFSVSAEYETFKAFLRDLEDSLRVVDIKDIGIQTASEGTFNNYTVSLDTYWLR